MRINYTRLAYCFLTFLVLGSQKLKAQAVFQDKPFLQDYSVKYYFDKSGINLTGVASDRNGVIQVISSEGLLRTADGDFLHPGTLVPDQTNRPLKDMKLQAIGSYGQQIVYLDQKAVLSNAWAGKLYDEHQLPQARIFAGTPALTFLVSDGSALHVVKDGKVLWKGSFPADEVIAAHFQPAGNAFWILGKKSVYTLSGVDFKLTKVLDGAGFTAFALTTKKAIIGTNDGYLELDVVSKKQIGAIHRKLPWTEITAVVDVAGKLWFGTTKGAFSLRPDGKYDYYNGERWLPGNQVTAIAEGPKNSILILTTEGLGKICFKSMTLHDKAVFFDDQVRARHIRNGFNASLDRMQKGNLATGYLSDSDNDGLWTSMYLAGEVFRYAVTKDKDALQNCRESLDAMERLYTINPVPGFPARSFERAGYIKQLHDSERWQHSQQPGWDWKSTTSSDEIIGHIFVFGAMAELVDDKNLQRRSITLIDTVMSHILSHDLYLIDFDGKPTMWGKWNPEYVNNFPINVGDRKLNSSNIVAMLQTAYHFTKKEKYKKKALELMQKHGYLENLMRPMSIIGKAPADADEHSKHMSDGWNHSDDEMYFVGYWGLYRYAFDDALKAKYKKAIIDHWEVERPEKDGAWNIFTALTGTKNFDLPEAIWYLQQYPLDMIDWSIMNSHRKDIDTLAPNFRGQTTKEVLPPDESPIQRHNSNTFTLDRSKGNSGTSEHSAGDIWLLPYWMGRYLGVISAPAGK
ncbi:hypothetical protein GO755_01405 [Spirosoma sp. HMF4905]|uniref:Transcriptional regulator n=1 Tax=Spirosoma arboris TaxID=2682092 RepID=A0A7K1S4E1_9BACT|nr:hypothetical protein [Spirosoma arboris]MVM28670.1 hypothetical protein [Spirosoma arboris]